jgi:hypothetical protein
MELELFNLYLIILGAILGALSLRRFVLYLDYHDKFYFNTIRRRLLHTLVTRRRLNGSTNLTVFCSILLLMFAVANLIALFIQYKGRLDLTERAGWLSLINLTILIFGGGSSLLTEHFLGLPLYLSSTIHRWIGRLCLVHILVHSVVKLSLQEWNFIHIINILVSKIHCVLNMNT